MTTGETGAFGQVPAIRAKHDAGAAALDAARDLWFALSAVAPADELRARHAEVGRLIEAWLALRDGQAATRTE